METIPCKIILLGEKKTGKTSIINKLINHQD